MTWQHWLKGLIAAFIGGAANGVTAVIVAPEDFNLGTGLGKLGTVCLVSGVIAAALYLKQSPVPPDEEKIANPSRFVPILLVALVLGAAVPMIGCHAPVSVTTQPGIVAYKADQIVIRINELQDAVFAAAQTTPPQIPIATARTLAQFFITARNALKATPDGWQAVVTAAWRDIRPGLEANAQVKPWLIVVDTLIGYTPQGPHEPLPDPAWFLEQHLTPIPAY